MVMSQCRTGIGPRACRPIKMEGVEGVRSGESHLTEVGRCMYLGLDRDIFQRPSTAYSRSWETGSNKRVSRCK